MRCFIAVAVSGRGTIQIQSAVAWGSCYSVCTAGLCCLNQSGSSGWAPLLITDVVSAVGTVEFGCSHCVLLQVSHHTVTHIWFVCSFVVHVLFWWAEDATSQHFRQKTGLSFSMWFQWFCFGIDVGTMSGRSHWIQRTPYSRRFYDRTIVQLYR